MYFLGHKGENLHYSANAYHSTSHITGNYEDNEV